MEYLVVYACALTICLLSPKPWPKWMFWLIAQIGAILLIESYGRFSKGDSQWIYNFNPVADFCMMLGLVAFRTKKQSLKIAAFTTSGILIVWLLSLIWLGKLSDLDTIMIMSSAFVTSFVAAALLFEMANNYSVKLLEEPITYVLAGVILYGLTLSPIMGLYHYMDTNNNELFNKIMKLLFPINIMRYTLIALGMCIAIRNKTF